MTQIDCPFLSLICCKAEAEDLRLLWVLLGLTRNVCMQLTQQHPPALRYLIKLLLKQAFDFLFLGLAVGEQLLGCPQQLGILLLEEGTVTKHTFSTSCRAL